jgi:hypothetical protein
MTIILLRLNNNGAHSVPGCGDLEIGGLENRFQRTRRLKYGELTTLRKNRSGYGEKDQRTLSLQTNIYKENQNSNSY